MDVELILNGRNRRISIEPSEMLSETVRRLGVTSVKRGCGTSNCGLCTVLVDDVPYLSCSLLTARCSNKRVDTVEGLEDEIKKLAGFMADEGAEQCGFCTSGFMVNVISLKRFYSGEDDDFIKNYLSGNLCRCTGYASQMRAVKNFLEAK